MARYKYASVLKADSSSIFDQLHGPGAAVPHSGIYKCKGCGHEAACNLGDQLPPQNRHQHGLMAGEVRWQLIVATDAKPL